MISRSRLVERAEELSAEELESIAKISGVGSTTINAIENVFFSSPGELRVLVGPKGIGKTFAALVAARRVAEKGLGVRFYAYREFGRVEEVNLGFKPGGDAYVFDDLHYLCEAVVKGHETAENLVSFMETAVKMAEAGKPVLVISEDMPSLYFERIEQDKLREIGPKFSRIMLMDPPSFEEWLSIPEAYGIKGDELGYFMVYKVSHKPRFLLRVAKLVDGLYAEDLLSKTRELLEAKKIPTRRREALLNMLKAPFIQTISPSDLRKMKRILSLGIETIMEIEENIDLLRLIAHDAASQIRSKMKNPFRPGDWRSSLWWRSDVFVVKQAGLDSEEVKSAINRIPEKMNRSKIASLFKIYCRKNYEEIQYLTERFRKWRMLETARRTLDGYSYNVLWGEFLAIEPMKVAFEHLMDAPTSEVIEGILREIKWRALFDLFKARVSNFDAEMLIALRRTFKNAAPNDLRGRYWRVRLIEKMLRENNFRTKLSR